MSHNEDDPNRSASNHRPAIIAIVLALLVAVVAWMAFTPGSDEQNDGIATTAPPGDTTSTPAEGTDGAAPAPASPESAAPEGAPAEPAPAN